MLFVRRPSGVDDLLKLAQQFDLNMWRQDEREEEEDGGGGERSPELLQQELFHLDDVGPHVPPDLNLEDNLDFLFDGPTQHPSTDLSQASSHPRPPPSSRCSASDAVVIDAFEDDWDVDDLLDDSLVLEVTQNPQNFATPKYSSTQKPSIPARLPVGVGQSAAEKPRHRTSFNLKSNPDFCVRTEARTNESDALHSRFSSTPTSVTANMAAPEVAQNHEAPAAADLLDDELLAIFSSDPWDDPADDHLLCELCDNLENQVRNPETVSTNQTVGNQRAANRKHLLATDTSLAGRFVSCAAAGEQTGGTVESAPQRNAHKTQFTFKKPSNPVSMTTNQGKIVTVLHFLS